MSGQIHPKNLFDLRPDLKALVLLGKLRQRNAESIFGAIADEMTKLGCRAAARDRLHGRSPRRTGPHRRSENSGRREEEDVRYGFRIAKENEPARHRPGRWCVKAGTVARRRGVLRGLNSAMKRGGETRAAKDAVMVKVFQARARTFGSTYR